MPGFFFYIPFLMRQIQISRNPFIFCSHKSYGKPCKVFFFKFINYLHIHMRQIKPIRKFSHCLLHSIKNLIALYLPLCRSSYPSFPVF